MQQDKKKETFIQFIKFTLFSISAGIIQFGSFALLFYVMLVFVHDEPLRDGIANAISLVLSVIWNFTLNRKFTFKSAANVPIAMLKVAGYYAVFVPLSSWWSVSLKTIGWHELIILAGTMIINFVTEFLFTRYVVYHNQINTALKKDETLDTRPID